MGKGRRSTASLPPKTPTQVAITTPPLSITTATLRSDPNLGYKIKVLLYDLRNIEKDYAAVQRIQNTVDALYISTPYFTPEEAARVKSATVDSDGDQRQDSQQSIHHLTVEEAIHTRLEGFFGKRGASEDKRPCGPHDMGPVYEEVFGISKEELQDERFLSRLRRQGLP